MAEKNGMKQFMEFIDNSTSCFHAVKNLAEDLKKAGFQRLDEKEVWQIQSGGSYYVTRNDSSILAFKMPAGKAKGFHVMASHSDFPCFKIKENAEMTAEEQYVKLNTEKYGGMILSTWMDRPLSIAGRLVIKGEHGLETKLVSVEKDYMMIPNLAIHMNPDMNKGVEYNPQIDMLPVIGGIGQKGKYLEHIANMANVKETDILGTDLFVYNRDQCKVVGADGEYLMAPRIDDLECAYTSVRGLIAAEPQEYVAMSVVFDNEEVGSGTKQGAASTFLKDCLLGICEGIGESEGNLRRMLPNSFMMSADNAHGVHPNQSGKADPTNKPYLNGGIVMKYHGSQKYTTDAFSSAYVKDLCNRCNVPVQSYANRSDIAGGSTLGNISAAQVSMPAADIGLAQWAMHSAYETTGVKDFCYMIQFAEAFFKQ